MELIEAADFFERVRSYLDERTSLSRVEDWVVEHLPALVPPRRDAVSELAGRIQLWAAELSLGHRDEDEVRALVEDYLRQRSTIVVLAIPEYAESTSTNVFSLGAPILQQAEVQASLSLRK